MGDENYAFDWGNLAKFHEDLDEVKAQAGEVEDYARSQVFTKAGVDYPLCFLQPLSIVLDELAEVFGEMRATFDGRWDGLVGALDQAAQDARAVDDATDRAFIGPVVPGDPRRPYGPYLPEGVA